MSNINILCYNLNGDIYMNQKVYKNMKKHEKELSRYAFPSEKATYFKKPNEDIRTSFFHDIDKIIYALSYIRYMDKTQVFSFDRSDHITKRMLHVQYVSKIARTIGRALNLNEDLIEAIALGHDLGHVPFGHVGEFILSDISKKHKCGCFNHNIHSVRMLMFVENYGRGLNISMEVLDGIMCHNGEVASPIYKPDIKKSKKQFLKEYELSYKSNDTSNLTSKTLEGCVVRISDLIAYLGRDIEDAIRMKLIKEEDIPSNIKESLGVKNKDIVNTFILDVIANSLDKPYIKLSNDVFNALEALKQFNYKYIYNKVTSDERMIKYKEMFNSLFNEYLDDLQNKNESSLIFKSYLNNMDESYYLNNSKERIVIDYIAGMTDDYFIKQYNKIK